MKEIPGITELKFLAKGSRGYVYFGKKDGKEVAVKTANPDSEANLTLHKEAKFLRLVNSKGIGPILLSEKEEYLIMEYIQGIDLKKWYMSATPTKKNTVIKLLIEQMRVLDELKISKNEMIRPYKNVIMKNDKPILIDFERSSIQQNPKNLTQFIQFLINRKEIDKTDRLKSLLKNYKNNQSEKNYDELKKALLSQLDKIVF